MQDFALYEENRGTATADRTPITAVTVSNSTIEKPLLFNLFRVFISMPTSISFLWNGLESTYRIFTPRSMPDRKLEILFLLIRIVTLFGSGVLVEILECF